MIPLYGFKVSAALVSSTDVCEKELLAAKNAMPACLCRMCVRAEYACPQAARNN